jgi:hypothetical protein
LRAGHRLGRESAQHFDMGMPAAEQDESLHRIDGTARGFISVAYMDASRVASEF